MKAQKIFTWCLLCAGLLFTGCIKDPIHVAKPEATIIGKYELRNGDELGTLTLTGVVEYKTKYVKGSLAWKDPSLTFHEIGEEQVEWIFTPAESMFAGLEGKIGITVLPKIDDPSLGLKPTVSITGIYQLPTDDPLGSMILSGNVEYNGRPVEGKLEWKNSSLTFPEAGEEQVDWIFTPSDKYLYAVVEGKITITVTPSIYVSGVQMNHEGKLVSKIWKNEDHLYTLGTNDADIGNMVFSNGHLYTCGSEKNKNQIKVSKIWKDGNLLYTLTNGVYEAEANSMIFAEGHLYTCGYEKNKEGIEVAKIWRGGRLYYTLTDGALSAVAGGITISNGQLYTCGYQFNEKGIENAKIWKDNKLLYRLTDGTKPTYAYSIMIVDDMIYTLGKEYINGNYVAKVWKNNRVLFTTDENLNTENFGMTISNDHIYQCVGERSKESGGETTLKILKDGKLLYTLTDGSHYAHAYSIKVSGDDVYTCGVENVNNVPIGKVWKNDTLLYSKRGVTFMDIVIN